MEEFPKAHRVLKPLGDVLRALHGSIMDGTEFAENTGIEILKKLQQGLSELHAVMGDFHGEEGFKNLGNNLSTVLIGLVESVRDIQGHLGLEEGEDEPPAKRAKIIERVEKAEVAGKDVPQLKNAMTLFANELAGVKQAISGRAGMHGSSNSPRGGLEATMRANDTQSQLAERITEAMSRLGALEQLVRHLDEKNQEGSGKLGGYRVRDHDFTESEAAKAFLSKAGGYGTTCEYYFDIFSLGAYCDRTSSGRLLEDKVLAKRAGFDGTTMEVAVLMSFPMDRPPQFGFERDIVHPNKAKDPTFVLPLVKSLDDLFSSRYGKTSVVTTMKNGYVRVNSSLNEIRGRAVMSTQAQMVYEVANEMINDSIVFIRSLHSEFEYFYKQVTSDAFGSTEGEAWALISEMISAVLKEIFVARTSGYGEQLADERDPEERTAKVLSSTFRAHAKMHEIRSAGFTKHSCVVPALSLHLFARKASIHMALELKEELASVKNEIKEIKEMLSQLITRSELDKRLVEIKSWVKANPAPKKA